MMSEFIGRAPNRPEFDYRADIDGLRAIAVVLVLLFHAGIGMPGGYIGVDVFFVISGFLITAKIDRDIRSNNFSYLKFWTGRARRLVPAAVCMLTVSCLFGYLILLPADFREFGQSLVAHSAGVANFYFWRESGYFAGASEVKPLLHMWSLAVEEQFYVLMPVLMIFFRGILGRRYLIWLSLPLFVSLAWSIYSTSVHPAASFFLLPTRAWELLLGALLVPASRQLVLSRAIAELTAFVGVTTVFVCSFLFDKSTVFPGTAALMPCLGAAAVILANTCRSTVVSQLLARRPVVWIGLISYSLYLWHWPVFAYANYLRFRPLTTTESLYLVGLSFALGAASWWYIEMPFRQKRCWSTDKRVVRGALVASSVVLVIGASVHFFRGLPGRFEKGVLRAADARLDRNQLRHLHHDLPVSKISEKGLPRLDESLSNDEPLLAIIGDSHADALMPAMQQLVRELNIPTVCISRSATIPFVYSEVANGQRAEFYRAVCSELSSFHTLREVVLIGRWTAYPESEFSKEAWLATLAGLRDLRLRVWVIRQVPEPCGDVPRALALAKHWHRSTSSLSMTSKQYLRKNSIEDAVFSTAADDNVAVVDAVGFFFPDADLSLIEKDGLPLYYDADHLSAFGARQLIPTLEPIFRTFAEGRPQGTAVGSVHSSVRPLAWNVGGR